MKRRSALAEVDLAPYAGHPRTTPENHSSERTGAAPQRQAPPRGRGGAWGGRAAIAPRVPVSRGSTAQVQGLYPWPHGAALPAVGAYIGVDCVTGGAFCCHPLAWLLGELISNPNIAITGDPGRGKSAMVKALVLRLLLFGLRAFIAGDLKGEYAPLARAVGAEPVELGPGLPARLNPLDAGPLGQSLPSDPELLRERLAEIHRRRLVLLCALAAVRLKRDLTPTEETAAARDTFMPPPGTATDLASFLRAGGTAYLMADERRSTALAPVMSAFADDFIETAKTLADRQPGGRLDPPLMLALDEVANIVPLPQLPALMSFAGGTGLFVTAVLQSMAQARHRWGQDAAAMLWGAATVKIALGGLAGDDLREISELSGEYRETVLSWQRGQGGHSVSSALTDRKTLTPEQVRTLRSHRREALVIHATTPAARVRLTRHYEGPHKAVFAASETEARRIAGLDRTGTAAPEPETPLEDEP